MSTEPIIEISDRTLSDITRTVTTVVKREMPDASPDEVAGTASRIVANVLKRLAELGDEVVIEDDPPGKVPPISDPSTAALASVLERTDPADLEKLAPRLAWAG